VSRAPPAGVDDLGSLRASPAAAEGAHRGGADLPAGGRPASPARGVTAAPPRGGRPGGSRCPPRTAGRSRPRRRTAGRSTAWGRRRRGRGSPRRAARAGELVDVEDASQPASSSEAASDARQTESGPGAAALGQNSPASATERPSAPAAPRPAPAPGRRRRRDDAGDDRRGATPSRTSRRARGSRSRSGRVVAGASPTSRRPPRPCTRRRRARARDPAATSAARPTTPRTTPGGRVEDIPAGSAKDAGRRQRRRARENRLGSSERRRRRAPGGARASLSSAPCPATDSPAWPAGRAFLTSSSPARRCGDRRAQLADGPGEQVLHAQRPAELAMQVSSLQPMSGFCRPSASRLASPSGR
jgi:hypothetical protein